MDSSVSPKDEIWFLRVCHHISTDLYRRISPCPEHTNLCLNKASFYGEELLAPRPTPASWKTTPCRLSATAYSIYSQLPSLTVSHFSIRNLRTRHVLVKLITWYTLTVQCYAWNKFVISFLISQFDLSYLLTVTVEGYEGSARRRDLYGLCHSGI